MGTPFAVIPVEILELDLDWCANVYGSAPCTAAAGSGNECRHTFSTCQDKPNYSRTVNTVRFCSRGIIAPAGLPVHPYLDKVRTSPTEINVKDGVSRRSNTSVILYDEPIKDVEGDPYFATRPAPAGGTFWTRLIARNPNAVGRPARIKRAFMPAGDPWSDDLFVVEHYIIETIRGPAKNGTVEVVLKDPVKLADRVKVPVPSAGKLAVVFTNNDLELTLEPGQADVYPAAGYVRVGKQVSQYTGKRPTTGWGFENTVDGWTASGATLAALTNSVLLTSSGSTPQARRESTFFPGGTNRYLIARIRRIAGAAWDGKVYYQTSGHGESASYYKSIAEPIWAKFLNALKYSEAFDNAVWTAFNGATVTANSTTAPDGNQTADTVTDANASAAAGVRQTVVIVQYRRDTTSVRIAKDATGRATRFPALKIAYDGSNSATVYLDTATGQTSSATAGSVTVYGFGAVDRGDFWELWLATSCAAALTTADVELYPAAGADANWATSNAAQGSIIAWGAQFAVGVAMATPYERTAALPAGEFVRIVADMHNLTAGGSDWAQNDITGVRLDLGASAADVFEIDYVALSPSASAGADVLYMPDGTYRAKFNTAAETAKVGDGVQLCQAWESAPVAQVVRDIFALAGLGDAYMDVPLITLEDENWLGAKYLITACLSEPEDASALAGEICIQTNAAIWWDPVAARIKFKVLGPRSPSDLGAVGSLTDDDNLVDDTVQVVRQDAARITAAAIYYELSTAVANRKEAASYLRGEINIDADAQSANEYGDVRQTVEFSRWFNAANAAAMKSWASRRVIYYRDAPADIQFALDAKDAAVQVGDLVDVSSGFIVGADGEPETQRVLVTKRAVDDRGRIAITARTTVFNRRYAFIAPSGHPNYTSANEAERAYAFICNAAGEMSNGDAGYRII